MAKVLTTKGITYELENIIKYAKEKIILVTPYIKMDDQIIERLKHTDENCIITIVFGKSNLNKKEEKKLNEIKKLNLYYYENLHAKCYLNEYNAIIASMNLYDYSAINNREIGLLLTSNDDKESYSDLSEEIKNIIENSKKIFDYNLERKLRSYTPEENKSKNVLNNHQIIESIEKLFDNSKISITEESIYIREFYNYKSRLEVFVERERYKLNFDLDFNYLSRPIFENKINDLKNEIENSLDTKISFEQEYRSYYSIQFYYIRENKIDKMYKENHLWTMTDISFVEKKIIKTILFIREFASDIDKSIPKEVEKIVIR